jgi:hypothetical protein
MIIIKLMGGLGNQFFQYTVGRNLALLNGAVLKIDISFYRNRKDRSYFLDRFNIVGDIASSDDIENFYSLRNRIKQAILTYYHRPIVYEKNVQYDKNILELKGDKYLQTHYGWQSEKYFIGISDKIRKELILKNEFKLSEPDIESDIRNSNSVSIHFRRGDYVDNQLTNECHGVCSLEYYYKAIELIKQKTDNPKFFIFTDDADWIRKNFIVEDPITFVSNMKREDYYELMLLSLCKHHIIANSTFSWWGAWLCEYGRKIVIAPEKWFNDKNYDAKDIVPEAWIKI